MICKLGELILLGEYSIIAHLQEEHLLQFKEIVTCA